MSGSEYPVNCLEEHSQYGCPDRSLEFAIAGGQEQVGYHEPDRQHTRRGLGSYVGIKQTKVQKFWKAHERVPHNNPSTVL